MTITVAVLLWAIPGREADLVAYETRVLGLIPQHGGRVIERATTTDGDGPLEIQLIEFPAQDSVDSYLADARRTALAADRDAAIARTELYPVDLA
ncbi:MAG: hypothetical protein ABJB03_01380 [Rhodoglobus sp.]